MARNQAGQVENRKPSVAPAGVRSRANRQECRARLATLKKLLKRKDVGDVINACDAGREGELIFRNIMKATA